MCYLVRNSYPETSNESLAPGSRVVVISRRGRRFAGTITTNNHHLAGGVASSWVPENQKSTSNHDEVNF